MTTYTFRPITEADFDRVTDLPEIQEWLIKNHLEKRYFDFDLDDVIIENLEKNISMIYFRCDRWWEENIYLLRIENQFCFFCLDRENKKFPNFEIIYWSKNISLDNEVIKNIFKYEIKNIFTYGGEYLSGNSDNLTIALLNNIKFREMGE